MLLYPLSVADSRPICEDTLVKGCFNAWWQTLGGRYECIVGCYGFECDRPAIVPLWPRKEVFSDVIKGLH